MSMQVGQSGTVKADINVTPLIDVVLVLLIIFMVVTPLLQKGEPVNLPRGLDPDKKPDKKEDLILSIRAPDETLWLSGNPLKESGIELSGPLEPAQVTSALRELYERDSALPLFIKADRALRYGVVKKAMLLTEQAGFKGVALVAEAPDEAPE